MPDPLHVVGVFADPAWAERGVRALVQSGFDVGEISLLAREAPAARDVGLRLLGAMPETLADARPYPLLAAGPLVGLLQGGDHGLTRLGLGTALVRAGFQRHDGHLFEVLVERGGILTAITTEPRAADALALLHSYGAGNAAIGAWAARR